MPRQPKHHALSAILNQDRQIKKSHVLRKMIANTAARDNIEERVEQCLPDALKGKFIVASLSHQQLTLHCSSAAIATRFRFEQDRFLNALQSRIGSSKVRKVKIQIRPNSLKPTTRKTIKSKSKNESREQTAGQRLEGVLERLSGRSSTLES